MSTTLNSGDFTQSSETHINWKAAVLFYCLACLIAWPFFWWRDINTDSWNQWHIPGIIKTWTYMWGPGLSVLLVTQVFYRNKLDLTAIGLWGNSLVKSLLFWFFPFLLLSIPGLPNSWGLNPHLFPLAGMGILGFISIIGEDSGWSYFLKNVLIKIPTLQRSMIIGTIWELWHFTNRTAHRRIPQAVIGVGIMIVILIALTYLMSKLTDRTKSLITAVTLHMWVNVLTENGCMSVYIVFVISVIFWILMFIFWDHPFWRRFQKQNISK